MDHSQRFAQAHFFRHPDEKPDEDEKGKLGPLRPSSGALPRALRVSKFAGRTRNSGEDEVP